MTARARFKQSEIERLIRAVKKTVDKPITGVEAIPGGGVRILTGEPANDALTPLQRWRAENAKRAHEGP